jgi:WD40 repeat protein
MQVSTNFFNSNFDSPRLLHFIYSPCGTYLFGIEGHSICKVNVHTKNKIIIAGNVKINGYCDGNNALFNKPIQLQFTPSFRNLLVCDYCNSVIRSICLQTHIVSTFAGNGRGWKNGPKEFARFKGISYILYSPDNKTLFVLDYENESIRCIDIASGIVSIFIDQNNSFVPFKTKQKKRKLCFRSPPRSIAFSPNGTHLLIGAEYSIYKINIATKSIREIFISTNYINDIMFDPNGALLFSESNIYKLSDDRTTKKCVFNTPENFKMLNLHYSESHNELLGCQFNTLQQFKCDKLKLRQDYLKYKIYQFSNIPFFIYSEILLR